MSAEPTRWSDDVAQGDWWTRQLDWHHDGIGFIAPDGFEAIARVFHPCENEDGTTRSWADIAAANGRVAHPQMQLHAIATSPGDQPIFDPNAYPDVAVGELPKRDRDELASILGSHAGVDECWFGIWEGYGMLHDSINRTTSHRTDAPRPLQMLQRLVNRRRVHSKGHAPVQVQRGPRIKAPSREYLLVRGALSRVGEAAALVSPTAGGQTPNLWWPDDQSWFVVTEIDFAWTYVCGTNELIEAVLASPILEALRADRNHQGHINADQINT